VESTQQPLIVWQGFEHSWTYNHRLNRLGDWVYQDTQNATYISGHSGATGLGPDSAYYKSHIAWLADPMISGGYLTGSLSLKGKEKKMINTFGWLPLPKGAQIEADNQYQAVLNGFDLVCLGKADKPQHLALQLGPPQWVDSLQAWAVPVEASAVFNCQSLECEVFVNQVDYKLNVYVLLMRMPLNYATLELQVAGNQDFDKKPEPDGCFTSCSYLQDPKLSITPTPVPKILAILAFDFELDKAHWFSSLGLVVEHKESGSPLTMMYAQSQVEPKSETAFPKYARLSTRKKGSYSLTASLIQIAAPQLRTATQDAAGTLLWPCKNGSPLHPDAVQEQVWPCPAMP